MNAEQQLQVSQCVQETHTNLLGFDEAMLIDFFKSLNQPKYRAQQLLKWVHQKGVVDFALMHTLPKSLRMQLDQCAQVCPPTISAVEHSPDGTTKWRIATTNETTNRISFVEMVRIVHNGRVTLCISSQAGCAVDCSFCVTGKQGFSHNLAASEIIGQLWLAQHQVDNATPITNVVFMGMGEPLLNPQAVLQACGLMTSDDAYGLSKRKVTISTSGIVPAMHDLCGKTQVALAISLHAADDTLRSELVPINKKYPIDTLLEAAKAYLRSLPTKRFITFEYTVIAGVNDSAADTQKLIKRLRSVPCKINLIPYNENDYAPYVRPADAVIDVFASQLHQAGYTVTVRRTRGSASSAACGQLAGQVQPRNSQRKNRHTKWVVRTIARSA